MKRLNDHIHVGNVSLNVSLNDDPQMLVYQMFPISISDRNHLCVHYYYIDTSNNWYFSISWSSLSLTLTTWIGLKALFMWFLFEADIEIGIVSHWMLHYLSHWGQFSGLIWFCKSHSKKETKYLVLQNIITETIKFNPVWFFEWIEWSINHITYEIQWKCESQWDSQNQMRRKSYHQCDK